MAPPSEFNEKGVVWALVCSIGDVCADVRVAAQTSLCTLGAQQPRPVLRALLHTCMQQPSPASCKNQQNLEFEEHNLSVCCNVLLNGMTKTEAWRVGYTDVHQSEGDGGLRPRLSEQDQLQQQ
ncbi:hypothetical protein FHG87_020043 [Trinorchestia longiramus]|nr:hypothetical protein FHG87_020043 [Trinorchestia longiramus]